MQLSCLNNKGMFGKLIQEFGKINGLESYTPDLMVRFVLADNMQYIDGSTVLYNSNHQDGVQIPEDTIAKEGINIGGYKIDANAYVRIKCRIVDNSLQIGDNKIVNWASVTDNSVSGEGSVSKDDSSVFLNYQGRRE